MSPKNYNNLNPIKARFIIKQIGLRNTNIIGASITITINITLIMRAVENDSERNNFREKCCYIHKCATIPNNLCN